MSEGGGPDADGGRPLEILLDARMVGPRMHGIARYAIDLARGLARLGQRVHLLAGSEAAADAVGREAVAGVVRCPVPFASPLECLRLVGAAPWTRFDVVHFPSFAVPHRPPPNAVITVHDLVHLDPPARLAHRAYYHWVLAPVLRARTAIAVSAWGRDDLVRRLGVPAGGIRVVRSGVRAPGPPGAPPVEPPFVLCVANSKRHKNAATAVEACRIAWNSGADFRLVLAIGDAPWPAARSLPRLVLPGPLPEDALASLRAHAAAVICPGRNEGFDYPLAEGLVAGARVLASDIPAHREFSGDRLSLYGPPDDAPALARRIDAALHEPAPAGAAHSVRTIDAMAADTLAVYREVASRGSRPRTRSQSRSSGSQAG